MFRTLSLSLKQVVVETTQKIDRGDCTNCGNTTPRQLHYSKQFIKKKNSGAHSRVATLIQPSFQQKKETKKKNSLQFLAVENGVLGRHQKENYFGKTLQVHFNKSGLDTAKSNSVCVCVCVPISHTTKPNEMRLVFSLLRSLLYFLETVAIIISTHSL